MTLEQPELTAPHAFQIVVLPSLRADGVAAHLGGHVATDGGVQMTRAALAHSGNDLLSGKDSVGAFTAQLAGDGKDFITASHASILHGLQVPR